MFFKQEIGKEGEDIAIRYLEKNNYLIIERNFRCRQGEIDIIALDKEELVFVEVKTRTNLSYGKPGEAVNDVKKKHIKNAIEYYLYKNYIQDMYIRIDVIEVYMNGNKHKINHIKQIV